MTSGVVLLLLSTFAAVLGGVATINRTERCSVLPGPFPPCIIEYQISLLAPLYPISAGLIGFGIIGTIVGTMFVFVGRPRHTGIDPGIPTSKSKE
jgi:hypothetical protein